MLDVLSVIWTVICAIIEYPALAVVSFIDSVLVTFVCLVGSKIACSALSDMYLTFLKSSGICLLGAGVVFVVCRPKLVFGKLHYFFVPHPVARGERHQGGRQWFEGSARNMAEKDDEYPRKGEIVGPSGQMPSVSEFAPATVSSMLSTAFWHNTRFRLAKRMFKNRDGAIAAHTSMLQAEAANAAARVEHRQAWERLDKDLDEILKRDRLAAKTANANAHFEYQQALARVQDLGATLENDRLIAEAKRSEGLTNALLAAIKAEDALEGFKAAKEARGKPATAAGAKSYSDRFDRHFSNRAKIRAARDDAIGEIVARAKKQGRDESHPEVAAEITEARQYAEELISKLGGPE